MYRIIMLAVFASACQSSDECDHWFDFGYEKGVNAAETCFGLDQVSIECVDDRGDPNQACEDCFADGFLMAWEDLGVVCDEV